MRTTGSLCLYMDPGASEYLAAPHRQSGWLVEGAQHITFECSGFTRARASLLRDKRTWEALDKGRGRELRKPFFQFPYGELLKGKGVRFSRVSFFTSFLKFFPHEFHKFRRVLGLGTSPQIYDKNSSLFARPNRRVPFSSVISTSLPVPLVLLQLLFLRAPSVI
ncbi:hypothetical protein BGX38DRAFT_261366 [Terfezia claveryi]|nr:hypothetical protein BGX38DRAFT_261366 [Terfezia claveryi]